MDLRDGQLVTPTLRLRRLLGQGGMGSVWLADHLSLQTQVAVKFLGGDMVSSPDAIERFRREATAAAQIRSPHVVQTLDHGLTAERVPYIVLELLEGEELGGRMAREPQLPLELVVRVVSQACKALAKAHSLGIVHRDIKPENIFLVDVDGDPFVKVLDFGIAKQTRASAGLSMTSTNSMIGTPYYMSPEQSFSSKDVDGRADLWALAVVAYYALTGDVPFGGETVGAICVAIDRAQFRPVTQLRPSLPPALDAWFARALARPLEARFTSAREMAEAFTAAVSDEVSAPRSIAWSAHSLPQPASVRRSDTNGPTSSPTPATTGLAPARRPPWLALAGAVLLGAGVLGYLASRPGRASVDPATTTGTPPTASASAPTAGTPTAGTPTAGTPAAGTPTAGTPTAGTPTAGTPTAGTPTAGTPTAGTPTAGAGAPAAGATASAKPTALAGRPGETPRPGKTPAGKGTAVESPPLLPPTPGSGQKVDRGF